MSTKYAPIFSKTATKLGITIEDLDAVRDAIESSREDLFASDDFCFDMERAIIAGTESNVQAEYGRYAEERANLILTARGINPQTYWDVCEAELTELFSVA